MGNSAVAWLLLAAIPVVLTTYLYTPGTDPPSSGNTEDVVASLVEQVQTLTRVVSEQGKHIETLEKRLNDVEAKIQLTDQTTGDTVKETTSQSPNANTDNFPVVMADQSKDKPDSPARKSLPPRGIREAARVAFTAYNDHVMTNMGTNQILKFGRTVLNQGGAFNAHTGIFTAPVSGIYFFTFTVDSGSIKSEFKLVVDNVNEVDALVVGQSREEMATNAAVISVSAGQSVWVETYHSHDPSLFGNGDYRYSTFTGFLLY